MQKVKISKLDDTYSKFSARGCNRSTFEHIVVQLEREVGSGNLKKGLDEMLAFADKIGNRNSYWWIRGMNHTNEVELLTDKGIMDFLAKAGDRKAYCWLRAVDTTRAVKEMTDRRITDFAMKGEMGVVIEWLDAIRYTKSMKTLTDPKFLGFIQEIDPNTAYRYLWAISYTEKADEFAGEKFVDFIKSSNQEVVQKWLWAIGSINAFKELTEEKVMNFLKGSEKKTAEAWLKTIVGTRELHKLTDADSINFIRRVNGETACRWLGVMEEYGDVGRVKRYYIELLMQKNGVKILNDFGISGDPYFLKAAYDSLDKGSADPERYKLVSLLKKYAPTASAVAISSSENAEQMARRALEQIGIKNTGALSLEEITLLLGGNKQTIRRNRNKINAHVAMKEGARYGFEVHIANSGFDIEMLNKTQAIGSIPLYNSAARAKLPAKKIAEILLYGINGSKDIAVEHAATEALYKTLGKKMVDIANSSWSKIKPNPWRALIEGYNKDPRAVFEIFRTEARKLAGKDQRNINDLVDALENHADENYGSMIVAFTDGKRGAFKISDTDTKCCAFLPEAAKDGVFRYAVDPGIVLVYFGMKEKGIEVKLEDLKVVGVAIGALATMQKGRQRILYLDSIDLNYAEMKRRAHKSENGRIEQGVIRIMEKYAVDIGAEGIALYQDPFNDSSEAIIRAFRGNVPESEIRLLLKDKNQYIEWDGNKENVLVKILRN
jgi:hypothetical protein